MKRDVREILKEKGFSFEKKFGQNFLTDGNLLSAIAYDSGAADFPCVEVGCGAGTLTRKLAEISPRVIGFEIDGRLVEVLDETLADFSNTTVKFEDFLKTDLSELEDEIGEDYVVCANLPYYITTPVLMKFLEEGKRIRSLTVMVQEEVARRLEALPGTSEYGAVTVAVNLIGSAKILRKVNRKMFLPAPNVDSAVVKIDVDRTKQEAFSDDTVRKLARCAFAMRRKTLVNNISSAFPISRDDAVSALRECNLPEAVRGERLSANDFVRLAEELKKYL